MTEAGVAIDEDGLCFRSYRKVLGFVRADNVPMD